MAQTTEHMPSNSRTQRIYYIDAARAFLMFLGIPYHTSLAYSYFSSWTVKADDLSFTASCLGAFIHSFRMPAFFVIAGYFSLLILQKKTPGPWLRYRMPRLVVPMLFVGIAINPFVMLARSVGSVGAAQVESDWVRQLTTIGSHWVAQLWFLGDLVFFSLLLAGLMTLPRVRATMRIVNVLRAYSMGSIVRDGAYLVALGLFVVAAAVAVKLLGLSQFANGFIYPSRSFSQLPFFFFGAFLALSARNLDHFTQFRWSSAALSVVSCILFATLTDREDTPSIIATFFITPAVGILSSQLIFSVARLCFNRPAPLVELGVESSMTVYLVHMIFVVWLVLAFRLVALPAMFEVVAISVVATALSVSISLLAQRIPLLFFLLHGYARKVAPGPRIAPIAPHLRSRFRR